MLSGSNGQGGIRKSYVLLAVHLDIFI